MIFCVDLENVHTTGLVGLEHLDERDIFIVFYSSSIPYLNQSDMNAILDSGCKFEAYKLVNTGKNALDFYICAKVGELIANCQDQEIAIIAKDKGYTALVDYVYAYGKNGCSAFMADNVRNAMIASKDENSRKVKIHEGLKKVSIEATYNKLLREQEKVEVVIEEPKKATENLEPRRTQNVVYVLPKKGNSKVSGMRTIRILTRRVYNMLKKVA